MSEEKPLLKSFSAFFDKKQEQNLSDQQLAEAVKKDLEALYPKIREYYAAYHESSIEYFVQHYAHIKHRFIKSADYYSRAAEQTILQFRSDAEECFWQIQQKKLFNLQCRWRAEQVKLEGVDCTYDFMKWEHDIENCPCVPPVTQQEVDLYIRYLQSPNCDVNCRYRFHNWQEYDTFKSSYQNEEEDRVPPWYSFYDTYMGTTMLMSLPDIRGPKELPYRRMVAEKRKQEMIKAGTLPEQKPYVKPKPMLNYFDKQVMAKFVSQFETSENMELYFNYAQVNHQPTRDDEYVREQLQNAMHLILSKAREHVPVEAHEDWRQGVIDAADKFKRMKIADAMPSVFEEYSFKMSAGIGWPQPEKNPYEWVDKLKEDILDGRALNGEPRDWDF